MRKLIFILISLMSGSTFGQGDFGGMNFGAVTGEIGPTIVSFDKPPGNLTHVDCKATFINLTNTPLQVNWLHPSGRMQKLVYMAGNDTVTIETKTHHRLIVCYQGRLATTMFIPIYDLNICKIYDKQFNYAVKIPSKLYKPIPGDLKAGKIKFKPESVKHKTDSPVVLFDEAHLNNYKVDGLFKPFAQLLKKDGYSVKTNRTNFTAETLNNADILVIANAYGQNVNGWLVDSANALTRQELNILKSWILQGGSLLLVMDHIPYPARVENIASSFGFTFYDCHVLGPEKGGKPDIFSKEDGTLKEHPITGGLSENSSVNKIAAFWGSGMEIPAEAKSIITYPAGYQAVFSHAPWKLEQSDYRKSAEGLSMAATMEYGSGKIAVFCEIDMFTALKSKSSGNLIGMNHPDALQNPFLILNTFHWLEGLIQTPK